MVVVVIERAAVPGDGVALRALRVGDHRVHVRPDVRHALVGNLSIPRGAVVTAAAVVFVVRRAAVLPAVGGRRVVVVVLLEHRIAGNDIIVHGHAAIDVGLAGRALRIHAVRLRRADLADAVIQLGLLGHDLAVERSMIGVVPSAVIAQIAEVRVLEVHRRAGGVDEAVPRRQGDLLEAARRGVIRREGGRLVNRHVVRASGNVAGAVLHLSAEAGSVGIVGGAGRRRQLVVGCNTVSELNGVGTVLLNRRVGLQIVHTDEVLLAVIPGGVPSLLARLLIVYRAEVQRDARRDAELRRRRALRAVEPQAAGRHGVLEHRVGVVRVGLAGDHVVRGHAGTRGILAVIAVVIVADNGGNIAQGDVEVAGLGGHQEEVAVHLRDRDLRAGLEGLDESIWIRLFVIISSVILRKIFIVILRLIGRLEQIRAALAHNRAVALAGRSDREHGAGLGFRALNVVARACETDGKEFGVEFLHGVNARERSRGAAGSVGAAVNSRAVQFRAPGRARAAGGHVAHAGGLDIVGRAGGYTSRLVGLYFEILIPAGAALGNEHRLAGGQNLQLAGIVVGQVARSAAIIAARIAGAGVQLRAVRADGDIEGGRRKRRIGNRDRARHLYLVSQHVIRLAAVDHLVPRFVGAHAVELGVRADSIVVADLVLGGVKPHDAGFGLQLLEQLGIRAGTVDGIERVAADGVRIRGQLVVAVFGVHVGRIRLRVVMHGGVLVVTGGHRAVLIHELHAVPGHAVIGHAVDRLGLGLIVAAVRQLFRVEQPLPRARRAAEASGELLQIGRGADAGEDADGVLKLRFGHARHNRLEVDMLESGLLVLAAVVIRVAIDRLIEAGVFQLDLRNVLLVDRDRVGDAVIRLFALAAVELTVHVNKRIAHHAVRRVLAGRVREEAAGVEARHLRNRSNCIRILDQDIARSPALAVRRAEILADIEVCIHLHQIANLRARLVNDIVVVHLRSTAADNKGAFLHRNGAAVAQLARFNIAGRSSAVIIIILAGIEFDVGSARTHRTIARIRAQIVNDLAFELCRLRQIRAGINLELTAAGVDDIHQRCVEALPHRLYRVALGRVIRHAAGGNDVVIAVEILNDRVELRVLEILLRPGNGLEVEPGRVRLGAVVADLVRHGQLLGLVNGDVHLHAAAERTGLGVLVADVAGRIVARLADARIQLHVLLEPQRVGLADGHRAGVHRQIRLADVVGHVVVPGGVPGIRNGRARLVRQLHLLARGDGGARRIVARAGVQEQARRRHGIVENFLFIGRVILAGKQRIGRLVAVRRRRGGAGAFARAFRAPDVADLDIKRESRPAHTHRELVVFVIIPAHVVCARTDLQSHILSIRLRIRADAVFYSDDVRHRRRRRKQHRQCKQHADQPQGFSVSHQQCTSMNPTAGIASYRYSITETLRSQEKIYRFVYVFRLFRFLSILIIPGRCGDLFRFCFLIR